ncbi:MAG: helix-turn-helix domain-containing protein [Clostridiales bacterium]|nr:helix-turn-helix domain-containing protein [Clostridiales bacterium]
MAESKDEKRVDNNKKNEASLRKQVARMLQVARWSEKMSQEEVASILGTKKSSISRIESGAQNLTVDYLSSYAQALGKEAVLSLREAPVTYAGSSSYELKLYDEVLLSFTMTREPRFTIEVSRINEDRRDLFPLDLEPTPEGLQEWLSNRTIPRNREMVGSILEALGLEITDIKGITDVCFGLSLNDSYWVVQKDFEGSFEEYNLYENEFSHALSLIAYTGGRYEDKKFRTSPELTTGGMLRKAWRFFGPGDIWLYKGGTFGFANTGNEPYSEFLASQVAEAMGINAVHYELERWMGILASKCRLFTDIDTSFIPIGRIVRSGGIDACVDYYRQLGDEFYQQLVDMLVFDAVILNEDRHFGNFGLMRDNHTGKILAPAPVFDNGSSLLCYGMRADFDSIDSYISGRANPYGPGNEFIPLACRLMGNSQRKKLRKLLDFRFAESDVSNLPGWRITALEEMIRSRAKQLLT